jgi:hypothetical protein
VRLGALKYTYRHTAVWRRSYLSLLLSESRLFSATASTITTEKKKEKQPTEKKKKKEST